MKKSRVFETESTLGQLISLSVLEAVAIIHKGFAYRASFADFVNDNTILLRVLGAKLVSCWPNSFMVVVLVVSKSTRQLNQCLTSGAALPSVVSLYTSRFSFFCG